MCTYKHDLPGSIPDLAPFPPSPSSATLNNPLKARNLITPPPQSKRPRDERSSISTEFLLCKTNESDKVDNKEKKIDLLGPQKIVPILRYSRKPKKLEKQNISILIDASVSFVGSVI